MSQSKRSYLCYKLSSGSDYSSYWANHIFWLLLIYSLLPGFSKIFGNQIFFLGSIPIIIILLKPFKNKYKFYKQDYPYIIFLFYICVQAILYLIFPVANKLGICMSLFMNVIPMMGYVYSQKISLDDFFQIFIRIVLIHCVIAILIYPYFNFGISNHPYVIAMKTGDAMGRMTSVSGSLGFGNMIMMGFIISMLKEKKFIPIILFCWVFSGQRSAWIGGVFGLLLYVYELVRQGSVAKGMKIIVCIIITALLTYFVLSEILSINLDFIEYRISRIGNAASERDSQWLRGWHNFLNNYMGHGGGQAGQISSRHSGGSEYVQNVPDGDYFRILSEYGFVGVLFFIITIVNVILLLIYRKLNKTQIILVALVCGCLLQMIGSNITEFYFTNFVIWFFIGKFYKLLGQKILNYRRTGP